MLSLRFDDCFFFKFESIFQLDLRNDVIRIAPAPLYNSFSEVYRFVSLLKTIQI